MKKKWLLLAVITVMRVAAQEVSADRVLMQIGDETVTVGEFERMYTKNLDLVQDPKQKDIDYYKDLFINYKLQLLDAKAKKYHKDWNFRNEFARYRRELAAKYLSDPAMTDKLLKEAYDRMQKDIKVSHIMVALPKSPTPADTLSAWKKINRIYRTLKKGIPFEKAAVKYSEDPSVRHNKGHLGWINVFQTVYPFETAAYNTPVGKFSKPFRTKFGYHIVWKEAERPAVYKVQVRQIVVTKKNEPAMAKQKIESIYEQLKKGEDTFENLEKRFSEDPRSAKQGGLMAPFGLREKIPAFEKQAFALKNPGDISKPFETERAWHIIQLVKRIPLPPYKDIKDELRSRIAKSDRSKLGREKLLKKLRKDFPIEMTGSLKPVYALVDSNFFKHEWDYPKDFSKMRDVLMRINGDYPVTYRDFINFLYRKQLNDIKLYARKKAVLDGLFNEFKDEQLFKYYESHLEQFYPDFAATVKEYYDGLLLFNYKTKEIWEKALKDTVGLEKFYAANKEKYRQPARVRFVHVQTVNKKLARKLYKALKKGADLKQLMDLAGKDAVVDVRILNKDASDKILEGKKYRMLKKGNKYIVEGVSEEIPEHIPPLRDIRGKVMSDYQQLMEDKLLKDLQKKYSVKIYEDTWQKLRAKYKKN
jgi:peptidyl-prolyl cis-trans isomerase SurA